MTFFSYLLVGEVAAGGDFTRAISKSLFHPISSLPFFSFACGSPFYMVAAGCLATQIFTPNTSSMK